MGLTVVVIGWLYLFGGRSGARQIVAASVVDRMVFVPVVLGSLAIAGVFPHLLGTIAISLRRSPLAPGRSRWQDEIREPSRIVAHPTRSASGLANHHESGSKGADRAHDHQSGSDRAEDGAPTHRAETGLLVAAILLALPWPAGAQQPPAPTAAAPPPPAAGESTLDLAKKAQNPSPT